MTIPNGWHIKYNPKPIPIRGHDWDFWHDEVDNDSRLCGTAGSEEDAKLAIMEKQAERHGFDKYADEPDDFDSHINIESLQYIIADMQRDLLSRDNQITILTAKLTEQEAELVKLRKVAEAASAIRDLEQRIAALEEERRWIPVEEKLPESGVAVLAHYKNRLGKSRRIRAKYVAHGTEEACIDVDDCELEWSEDEETAWIKAGWYELMDNWDEYAFITVNEGEITEWMPLPPRPEPQTGGENEQAS